MGVQAALETTQRAEPGREALELVNRCECDLGHGGVARAAVDATSWTLTEAMPSVAALERQTTDGCRLLRGASARLGAPADLLRRGDVDARNAGLWIVGVQLRPGVEEPEAGGGCRMHVLGDEVVDRAD